VGKWTVTFNRNTNVTMTAPDGTTTNFNIPDDPSGTTANLFADPPGGGAGISLFLGVQANNAAAIADHVVISQFSTTGTAGAFTDNFLADNGVLNTSVWVVRAAYPTCVQLLPPLAPPAYWVNWTIPAAGYSLLTQPTLAKPAAWKPALGTSTEYGADMYQLVTAADNIGGSSGYFQLIQRTFTNLLVLLPGETNAPGTATGKGGTPTPASIGASGLGYAQVTVTIMAVDKDFFPVAGSTDKVHLTTTDGTALVANDAALVNGVITLEVDFGTTSPPNYTVTASDVTDATKGSNISTPIEIVP
jgi:hypothetical protein